MVVAACGNKCGACGKSGVKLERGHIIPHSGGGTDGLDNLLPVCLPCNKKFLKKLTPHNYRPADWTERFFLLLGHKLRPQISVSREKGLCYLIPAAKQAENTTLIDWTADVFGSSTEVFTQSSYMSAAAAEKAMWKLVEKVKQTAITNGTPPPKRPLAKRQATIMQKLHSHSEADCTLAADQFAREEEWVSGDKEHGRGYASIDSWQAFCESFVDLVDKGRARAVRHAQQAKVDHERKLADEAQGALYEREMRWNDYIRTADVPHWPGMLDGDADVIAAVATRKAAQPPQDVTSEQYEQSLAVFRRWKIFKSDELIAERKKVQDRLTQAAGWAMRLDKAGRIECFETIKNLTELFDSLKDVASIRKKMWSVDNLCADLDPDRPPSTDVF